MKYKQKKSYGCGLYAIANACNLDNFITEERLEQSKGGNNIGQLSKWLQEDGLSFYIDLLYYNHLGKKLPRTALNYKPEGDNVISWPILLSVRSCESCKNHLIGGRIDKEGILYLYDSLKDDVIETTLAKVNKMYHNVYGLYLFLTIDGGNNIFLTNEKEFVNEKI